VKVRPDLVWYPKIMCKNFKLGSVSNYPVVIVQMSFSPNIFNLTMKNSVPDSFWELTPINLLARIDGFWGRCLLILVDASIDLNTKQGALCPK
jgi:hypothetical protein